MCELTNGKKYIRLKILGEKTLKETQKEKTTLRDLFKGM